MVPPFSDGGFSGARWFFHQEGKQKTTHQKINKTES
jgi:hypothetical protein